MTTAVKPGQLWVFDDNSRHCLFLVLDQLRATDPKRPHTWAVSYKAWGVLWLSNAQVPYGHDGWLYFESFTDNPYIKLVSDA